MRSYYLLIILFISIQTHGQIQPPAGIGSTENIIMWLSPDTAVFNSAGMPATSGQNVYEWRDISGNGFVFKNTRNNRRPNFTTIDNKNYLDFASGDMLFNSRIADSINGLDEFSIFVVIKSDVTNTDNGLLYWKYPPDGDDDGLCLRYDKAGWWTGGSNLIKSGFQGNNGANQIETTSNTQTTNRQVLTLTWKKDQRIRSFIDGVENDSSDLALSSPLAGIQEILIGKGAKDETRRAGWNGKIGTFIFYNQQFNSDTVKDISDDLDLIFSVKSGNWDDPSSWDCNCIPGASKKVKIYNEHTITLTKDEEINNLTLWLLSGLELGNNTLDVYGNLVSHSQIEAQNGKIRFVGNTPQVLTSTYTTYYGDIDIDNPAGLTLTFSPIFVLGTINIISGNFNANDRLVLLSNDSITGRIASIPAGASISGNVTVQRYIYNSNRIYRYLSSPVTNAMVSDWQNEIPITGTFVNPDSGPGMNSSSPSLWEYDETKAGGITSGWTSYPKSGNSNAAPLVPGTGYSIFVRDNADRPEYVDVTGVINSGDISINLNYTNTGSIVDDGWNLIGNPYPSQIDWSLIPVTRKIGLDNAIYYTDNRSGISTFRSFVNGISIPPGGDGVIGSSQAFWVHANTQNPLVIFNESDKVGSSYNFYKSAQPSEILRIGIKEKTTQDYDESVIYLNEFSTDTFDTQFDAYKFGSNGVSISTKIGSDKAMGISSINLTPEDEKLFDLVLGDMTPGEYDLSFNGINTFDPSINIELIDVLTGFDTILTENSVLKYSITSNTNTYHNRFRLKLTNTNTPVTGLTDAIKTSLTAYPNPNNGGVLHIDYSTSATTNFTIELKDYLGKVIKHIDKNNLQQSENNFSFEMRLDGYSSGVYFLTANSEYGIEVIKVIIN